MRAEVWTAAKCAGGSRRAVLYPLGSAVAQWQTDNNNRLTLTVNRSADCAAELVLNRVVRLTTEAGDVTEWVITDISDAKDSVLTTVSCDPLFVLLGNVLVRHTVTGGRTYYNNGLVNCAVGNYVNTWALPSLSADGISWVTLGTVDATERFDLMWERWTVLELLNAIAARTATEFVFSRNGDVGYTINFYTEQGSSADTLLVHHRKNLLGLNRQRRATPLRTVVAPSGIVPDGDDGETATIAQALWKVTAVSGPDATVDDPAGNGGPVGFPNQLNGKYLLKSNASLTEVTASTTGHVVTVASITGVAVGDLVGFRADASGTLLHELTNPAAVTSFGRIVGRPEGATLRGEGNIIANPGMTAWVSNAYALSVNATVSGVYAALSGMASGTAIDANDRLCGIILPGTTASAGIFRITGSVTATDGTATVTCAATINSSSQGFLLARMGNRLPTGWTADESSSTTDQPLLLVRRPGEMNGTTNSGLVAAAVTNAAVVTLTNLTASAVIYPGDCITGSATCRVFAMAQVTANASGIATVPICPPVGFAAGATVTVTRPDSANYTTYSPVLLANNLGVLSATNITVAPYFTSPSYRIRYDDTLPTLWATAELSYFAGEANTLDATTSETPAHCAIMDASGTATALATITDSTRSLAALSTTDITLRVAHTITSDTTVAIRIKPALTRLYGSNPLPVATIVRRVSLFLASDAATPYVDGSHANKLWQLGNHTLADLSSEPITYTATIADLRELGITDEQVVLGGTVRVIDDELGVDTTLRLVGYTLDVIHPAQSQLTFSRLSPRLTRSLARKQQKTYAVVNIVNQFGEASTTPEYVPIATATEKDPNLGGGAIGGDPNGTSSATATITVTPKVITRFGRLSF